MSASCNREDLFQSSKVRVVEEGDAVVSQGLRGLGKASPNDADCWMYIESYKETFHVLFPALAQLDDLESELLHFLLARRAGEHQHTDDDSSDVKHTIFGRHLG